jgi:hypothetical protein
MFRLTRSRRLSRRSRAVSAVIGIAAVFWMIWEFAFRSVVAPPQVQIAGPQEETLSFAKLAPDEEIVVTASAHQRPPMEWRFRGQAEGTRLAVSEVVWSETDRAWKMSRVLLVRPLTPAEAAGIDAVVAELRRHRTPEHSHLATYTIDYRRNESAIGREKLFESLLVSERNRADQFAATAAPDAKIAAEETAAAQGVAPEVFWKWVTFEMLAPREDAPEGGQAKGG